MGCFIKSKVKANQTLTRNEITPHNLASVKQV